jgi:transposase
LSRYLSKSKVPHQLRTVDKVLAWAAQAADDPIRDGPMHHAIWTDLHELYQHFQRRIAALERQLACDVVQTSYVRRMAIPGINVVSAAELAAEMGPISGYANANAITGRAGLFPSRYQSDQTDNASARSSARPTVGCVACSWGSRTIWLATAIIIVARQN